MKSYTDRLHCLEGRRPALPAPAPGLAAEVRAVIAATPTRTVDRGEFLRALLARVDIGGATEADLALLALCSFDTLRIVERLDARV